MPEDTDYKLIVEKIKEECEDELAPDYRYIVNEEDIGRYDFAKIILEIINSMEKE